jgi:hypothetical protein
MRPGLEKGTSEMQDYSDLPAKTNRQYWRDLRPNRGLLRRLFFFSELFMRFSLLVIYILTYLLDSIFIIIIIGGSVLSP